MPTPEEEAAAKAEKEAAEKAANETAEAARKAQEATLGDAGKAALDAERKARKDAEKAAREAQAKLDALETASLSETERLKKEAEDGKALAASATEKLRKANLIAALTFAGVQNAKAAARLMDGVEYDDTDEPRNLDAAITAAKGEFGEDLFRGVKPVPPSNVNASEGNEHKPGPGLNAEELAVAQSFGMTPEEYEKYKDPQYRAPVVPAKT